MQCPDCNGPMWDNRPKKASGEFPAKRADFSCKNKQGCGKGVWLKDGENGGRGGGRQQGGDDSAASSSRSSAIPLAAVYGESLEIATRAVKHYLGDAAQSTDIIAAAATIFIAATQTGRPVKAPPKPAPPPPPPPPPKPEPAHEYSNAEDLPF